MIEYVHLAEGEDIGPEGRAYRLREEILDYKGRGVLCVKTEADGGLTFCDGSCIQALSSVFVKGYIIERKTKKGKDRFISKLEEIKETGERQEIREILEAKYGTSSIYFNSAAGN